MASTGSVTISGGNQYCDPDVKLFTVCLMYLCLKYLCLMSINQCKSSHVTDKQECLRMNVHVLVLSAVINSSEALLGEHLLL